MNKKSVRFLDKHPSGAEFVYIPPPFPCTACERDAFIKENPGVPVNLMGSYHTHSKAPLALNATMGVKFAQRTHILDDWYLLGGTCWSRTLFRLTHPIVYSKRGLRNLYRHIKRFFFGDPPLPWPREWKTKEEIKHLYPDKTDAE